ncbi:MAG: NB-ARC domain-containing protein [Chloroflexi bacterium]|nr:NB-ARC domain-containing protein [Chloroflexota bacterium]
MTLTLRLLGPVVAHHHGRDLTPTLTSQSLALLAYLAEQHGHVARRDTLLALLWPEASQANGRTNLRQALRRLRQQLPPELSPLIHSDKESVGLNPALLTTDTAEWHSHLGRADAHSHPALHHCPTCLADWHTAVALIRGPFAADLASPSPPFDEWLRQQQQTWHAETSRRLLHLAHAYEQGGDHQGVRDTAQLLLRLDPLHEAGHLLWLTAMGRMGNRAAALAHYGELVTLLRAELDVTPSPALQALAEQLRQDAPPVVSPVALPATPPATWEAWLPPPPTRPLHGRDTLLAQLIHRLTQPHPEPAYALHGLPGVGKSTLARALAHHPAIRTAFPDGLLWAGLGPQPDTAALLSSWAAALDIKTAQLAQKWTAADRAALLQRELSQRRMLLIVDDVWSEATAEQFRLGGANCVHLLTSRQPAIALAFAGTATLPVPELDEAAGVALLGKIAPHAVAQEPEAVRELVGLVGGLPLAVELMGRYLQKEAYGNQPRRLHRALAAVRTAEFRLRLSKPQSPQDFHPSVPPQQAISLPALLGLSEELLPPPAQRALHALSYLPAKPNSFTEEAGEAVAAVEVVWLEMLVDHGLLEPAGHNRLTMHQTIADFARQSHPTQGEEAGAIVGRLVAYFVAAVETLTQGGANGGWLEQEYANIRAALGWAKQGGMGNLLARGVVGMAAFWHTRGLLAEAGEWLDTAVALLGTQSPPLLAQLRFWQAQVAMIQQKAGDPTALEQFTAVLTQAKMTQQPTLMLDCWRQIGTLQVRAGQMAEGLAAYQAAHALAVAVGDARREAAVLNNLALHAHLTADYPEAMRRYEQALTLKRQFDDPTEWRGVLQNLGVVLVEQGRYASAESHYREALALHRQAQDKVGESQVLNNLGVVAKNRGAWGEALGLYEAANALREGLGDKAGLSQIRNNMGLLATFLGEYATAEHHLAAAQAWAQAANFRLSEGRIAENYAHLAYVQRDFRGALPHSVRALAIGQAVNNQQLVGEVQLLRGHLLSELQDVAAVAAYRAAGQIWHELGRGQPFLEAQLGLARWWAMVEETVEANALLDGVLADVDTLLTDYPDAGEVYWLLLEALRWLGRVAEWEVWRGRAAAAVAEQVVRLGGQGVGYGARRWPSQALVGSIYTQRP